MKIKKGDKVKVLLGKDRGKEGIIEYVLAKEKKVFVGGANLYKRHIRKMGNMEGGIINIPKPVYISNVGLICPNCKKITRVGYKQSLPTGKQSLPTGKIVGKEKLRICKKCKKEVK